MIISGIVMMESEMPTETMIVLACVAAPFVIFAFVLAYQDHACSRGNERPNIPAEGDV